MKLWDIIIDFLLENMSVINTRLSYDTRTSLKLKIEERINNQLIDLIQFLQKQDYVSNGKYFEKCFKQMYLKYWENLQWW